MTVPHMGFIENDNWNITYWTTLQMGASALGQTEKKQWMIGLFCGCATLYSCRTVMPLVAVPMAKEMGWDKTESGSVLSAFFWGYTMTQFLGGYLSDRVGGDVVLPIAACCWSLVTFWTPQLTYLFEDKYLTLRLIIFSRVLLGVFQGVYMPCITSFIGQFVPQKQRTSSVGFVVAGTYAGSLISRKIPEHERSLTYSIVCSGSHLGPDWFDLDAMYALPADRSTPSEVPTCDIGWVFNVVPWVVTIPSSIFGGWLADLMITKGWSVTFVRKFMNTITMLGTAFFLVVISYTTSYEGALVCMALAVACCGFHNSGILVNPQDIAPKHAGSVFGIMNMAGAIPGFIGVYMAGHILEVTKSWSAVFNQTAAVSVFGWIVYTIFGTGKQII
ncbi:PHT41-like protein [Mya arenaria]|uniref:PHT41-like protein n=1 Tax=Mya arenaria TaxID=6604 RepID=A0ABY7FND0_MYAAR|nr:PHT41-like protein [Mya arenaria]